MKKKEIRKYYKEKRLSLSAKETNRLDDLLLINFQKLSLPPVLSLLAYWPLSDTNEFDTRLCADFLAFRNPGMVLAYPVADFSTGKMQAVAVHEETVFMENEYGIPEPLDGEPIPPGQLDLIFVPLLSFDRLGNRVGYGKGFYDRYLADCDDSAVRLGFSYFDAVERVEDADEFDVPLTVGITPNRIYEF